jgi:DNA-binding MarR family transcriptional regulator
MKDLVEIRGVDPILRTFILFAQTARVVAKYQDTCMNKKTGLSDVKLIVLMAFYYDPNAAVTASEIARWTDTEPHNVTTLVNRMKKDGLLDAKRDVRDRRSLKITLTNKGQEVLRESMPAAQHVVDQVMSSISQDEALSLEKILRVIRRNAYDGLERLAESS